MARILVVGGSMGGLRAAEQLRRCGWTDQLVVLGQEAHMPYNRPPLSKELLREMTEAGAGESPEAHHASVAFQVREAIADVEWLLGSAAVRSDLEARTVKLDSGETIAYEGLVVATGLRSRRLPISGPRVGRYVVRTIDDAVQLRLAIRPGCKLVVIGGGFIGCEVAATARALGCQVTVVEPMSAPMEIALGPDLGRALQRHHERNGVEFHLGRSVQAIEGLPDDADRVGAVVLDDGTRLAASVIVESVGSHPNVEWLDGNGLDLSNGVLCDNWLRVEGRGDVVAVGDVARFPNPRYDDQPRRVEHWSMPADTAKRAAPTLVHGLQGAALNPEPFVPIPTFWSDQFDLRVNAVGAPALGSRIEALEGELGSDGEGLEEGLAIGYYEGGRLVGVVTVGLPPARLVHYRRELNSVEQVA